MDALTKTDDYLAPQWDPPVASSSITQGNYCGTRYPLYGGTVDLHFFPRLGRSTHVYMHNGQRIQGATTILRVIDKPALIYWALNEMEAYLLDKLSGAGPVDEVKLRMELEAGKKAHRQTSRKAATIGTIAHEWISNYIINRIAGKWTNDVPDMPENPQVCQAVSAFLSWESGHDIRWLSTERPVLSVQHGFCGTMDWEAVIDGKLIAGDLKTSNGIYPEMHLQLAAYQMAREEESTARYDGRLILRIAKEPQADGLPLFEARSLGGREEFEADRDAFLAAAGLYRRLEELKAESEGGR